MTDVFAFEMRAKGRNGVVIHQSGAPPAAPNAGNIAHLGEEADLSVAASSKSTLAGFIPLGCVGESPVVIAWEVLTQHLTHRKPLGWLGGILWPFCVLAGVQQQEG